MDTLDLTDRQLVTLKLTDSISLDIDPYAALRQTDNVLDEAGIDLASEEPLPTGVIADQLGALRAFVEHEATEKGGEAVEIVKKLSDGQLHDLHDFLNAVAAKYNQERQKKIESISSSPGSTPAFPETIEAGA